MIRTPRTAYRAPSVIRLQHQIRRPRPRVKLTRREVFTRDRYTCQYCGHAGHDLTLDHVLPRHRGGGALVGEPGHGLQGRATTARAGGRRTRRACGCTAHRSSPGTTSTRCSRRTSPTNGTRHGGHTCSSAATDRAARPAARRRRCGHGDRRCRPRDRARAPRASCEPMATPRYVVGGSVRDVLLGRPAADWDLATDALPERVVGLLPDAAYENRFGTVGVRRPDGVHEITTFRSDHEYADFRRPHRVEFGDSIAARPGQARLHRQRDGLGRTGGRLRIRRARCRARRRRPRGRRRNGRRRNRRRGDGRRGDGRRCPRARRSARRSRRLLRPAPPRRRRPGRAVRGGRAAHDPGRPARGDPRLHDRTGDAGGRSRTGRSWRGTSRANGSRSSSASCSRPTGRRSGCA